MPVMFMHNSKLNLSFELRCFEPCLSLHALIKYFIQHKIPSSYNRVLIDLSHLQNPALCVQIYI